MKGFCSGQSIEISLELNADEVSRLERKTIHEMIRRGHDAPPKFVDVYLKVGPTKSSSLMSLKVLPDGTDFERTTGYEIILSVFGYGHLRDNGSIVDRPKLGTKVSIYKK